MKKFMKTVSLGLATVFFCASVFAIELQDAKTQGLVGEMPDGYLGIVVDSAEVKALIDDVNRKRKQIYISLARENKIALKDVAALAGEKAINLTAQGHYVKDAGGNWVKK